MHQVAVSSEDPDLVYASARSGLFVSSDGGKHWQGISRGIARALEGYGIAINPTDSSHLVAIIGDSGPIPKVTRDGGETWMQADHDMWAGGFGGAGDMLGSISFSPFDSSTLFGIQGYSDCRAIGDCNDGKGVVRSRDGGQTWERIGLTDKMAVDLSFDADGSIYVLVLSGDLYRSDDNGQRWRSVSRNMASAKT